MGLQRQAGLQQQLLAAHRDARVLLDPLLQLRHRLAVRHRVGEDLGGHHVEDVNQLREEEEAPLVQRRVFFAVLLIRDANC